ncbi:MAG: molybdopterin-guanine dinucleotide biosynthesis protein B [Clostridiales bacterium]
MMAKNTPLISFVAACSDMGKTTILLQTAAYLKEQGWHLAVIKHGHHLALPPQTKDSSRYHDLGLEAVLILSPQGWLMSGKPKEEPTLAEAVGWLEPFDIDLILVEGYKNGQQKKIEVCRRALYQGLVCGEEELLAIISDFDLPSQCPVFDCNDISAIGDFIIDSCGLRK